MIKRALISVSDKTGIVDFARALHALNIEIISTGGTRALLNENQISAIDVSEITRYPEMMDGRVKTLHPKIHGGILGKRNDHAAIANVHGIQWIDLVIVNLYPFKATIQKPNVTMEDAIENIDIGGPTMIRSAAKNMDWVGVIVDPNDYATILQEITAEKKLSDITRKNLAKKAFQHTAAYDGMIADFLSKENNVFAETIHLSLQKSADLRYGENPHQKAAAYRLSNDSLLDAKQYQGKPLSYNNFADADAAFSVVQEFRDPAAVIVKHANPCGVATDKTLQKAFVKAHQADSLSAFGGIVALNRICDKETAEELIKIFFEVIVAPDYTEDALTLLATKPNLRVLAQQAKNLSQVSYKFIDGGFLVQEKDCEPLNPEDFTIPTIKKPTKEDWQSLLFAFQIVKHVKSNAIVIAKENVTLGIGAGQVSRVDAVDLALKKSQDQLPGAVLASDAFFPFRDSIDRLKDTGVKAIIQPGGSMRDTDVIAACDELGIAMVFTGKRCFNH
jgi:phosphoribosylaminoimidazolecarboxamide formyltransferase/IMP cyclohydrolase